MAVLETTVAVNLAGLEKFNQEIQDQLRHYSQGPISKAFKQWGAVYRSFIKERFDIYSKGGGDWPPLAQSTMLARRGPRGTTKKDARKKAGKLRARLNKLRSKLSKTSRFGRSTKQRRTIVEQIKRAKSQFKKNKDLSKRKFSILRDTGTLFAVLSPTFAGKPGQLEQEIPYGIVVGYGGAAGHPSAKKATIAEIANYHQIGAGHLPVRKIIVEPPPKVVDQMTAIMQAAVESVSKVAK